MQYEYIAATEAHTLSGTDQLVNCTANSFAVTLPTAVGFKGQYVVKNSGTGLITMNTILGQTIDGEESGEVILTECDSITLRSDRANWIII